MRKLIIAYIKFWLRSKNQHGIHSPFVFDLVNRCFYDKKKYNTYSNLTRYRKDLLHNKNAIEVTDLGVGSHILKHKTRVISDMAKNAGSTLPRTKLLFRLVRYFNPKNILELGTSLGIASHAMSLGVPEATITSIEGCPNISKFTTDNLKQNDITNVNIINGAFDEALNKLELNSYDLIYIDGNHQKEATINYFEKLLPTANNDTIFIFDDIYWSKGMTEAWNTIIQHPEVTVSIDTFFWGLIFFRKEQAKEHFSVRI